MPTLPQQEDATDNLARTVDLIGHYAAKLRCYRMSEVERMNAAARLITTGYNQRVYLLAAAAGMLARLDAADGQLCGIGARQAYEIRRGPSLDSMPLHCLRLLATHAVCEVEGDTFENVLLALVYILALLERVK